MPDVEGMSRDVRQIESIKDLVSVADELSAGAEVWWRGHSSLTYRLVPGAFRAGLDRFTEANRLLRFVRQAPLRRPNCPSPDDYPGWLFLAQHYGLPTRLLDWSESPLVAAFFAVDQHPEEPGALWALRPAELNLHHLERRVILSPRGTIDYSETPEGIGLSRDRSRFEACRLFAEAFNDNLGETEGIFAVMPDELDARMAQQLSMFTIHATDQPLEDLCRAEVRRAIIPPSAKPEIAASLSALGIRRSRIFPDLVNLARELRERRFRGVWPDLDHLDPDSLS